MEKINIDSGVQTYARILLNHTHRPPQVAIKFA